MNPIKTIIRAVDHIIHWKYILHAFMFGLFYAILAVLFGPLNAVALMILGYVGVLAMMFVLFFPLWLAMRPWRMKVSTRADGIDVMRSV